MNGFWLLCSFGAAAIADTANEEGRREAQMKGQSGSNLRAITVDSSHVDFSQILSQLNCVDPNENSDVFFFFLYRSSKVDRWWLLKNICCLLSSLFFIFLNFVCSFISQPFSSFRPLFLGFGLDLDLWDPCFFSLFILSFFSRTDKQNPLFSFSSFLFFFFVCFPFQKRTKYRYLSQELTSFILVRSSYKIRENE